MLYALSPNLTSQPTIAPTTAPTKLHTQQTRHLAVPAIKPQRERQKSVWIVGSLVVGGLLAGVAISTLTRQSQSNTHIVSKPFPPPVSAPTKPSISSQSSPALPPASPPQQPIASDTPSFTQSRRENSQPPEIFTPEPENTPTTAEIPAPEATSTPETENQPVPEPTPQADLPKKKANTTSTSVPAFPTGTARSTVEAALGKPNRDLRGVWRNTRAVVYRLVPNQVDLGYLFDRNTGALRQTEVAFAQSVDPEVMQTTLNGILSGQSNAKIQQGLQQIQQRQSDNFTFTVGGVKGQIVRQNCDLIYISVWDADLHDFVNPASAKQC
jgi:serine/threonine-protein kinase